MMSAQQQSKPHAGPEKKESQQLHAVIGRHVIHALGQPDDLHQVQVRPLWEGRYRVNVFTGDDATAIRIAHSYFLEADGQGNIIASTPVIARKYEPAGGKA
jgi:hypothetical protein